MLLQSSSEQVKNVEKNQIRLLCRQEFLLLPYQLYMFSQFLVNFDVFQMNDERSYDEVLQAYSSDREFVYSSTTLNTYVTVSVILAFPYLVFR